MRKPILLATLLLTLAACHKADDGPRIDFGPGDGFSYRDAANSPAGTQDPSDWTTDATWTDQEKALFLELSISLDGAPQPGFLEVPALYPNPARVATWAVASQKGSGGAPAFTIAAVLVDRDFREVLRLPHSYAGSGYYATSFDYAKLGLLPGERYRLYYVIFNTNGLVAKGHGDVRYTK
jgi:hypothetical protein